MEKKVASKQFVYAAVNLILATSLLTKHLYVIAKNEAWLVIGTGLVLSLLVLLMYISLAQRFPGLSLIGINDLVFGRIAGKIVSALYIFFFFTLAALNTNIVGSFIKGFVLPSTPVIFVIVIFVFLCAWAVRKGGANILMYSPLVAAVSIAVIMITTLLLVQKMDFRNLLPFLNLPLKSYVIGTHSVAILPLCDPIVLMMLLPVFGNPKEFGGAMAKGVTVGALILLIVAIRNIVVLGAAADTYSYPSITAIRQTDLGDVVTRIDIVYISALITLVFYKVSVMYYASVRGIKELMGFRSGSFLVSILGVLLIVYAVSAFTSSVEHQVWLSNGAAEVFNTFFVVALPALTLITAFCRGMLGKNGAAQDKAV